MHFTQSRMCFRRNGKMRKRRVAKRRDEESAEVGLTREAARISDPFDETPNVPLFAQQWRSNTGSCPFRRSRRYFTYLRRGTLVVRIRPRSCDFNRLPENITAWRESGFNKDIRELTDFLYRPLLNLPRCAHIVWNREILRATASRNCKSHNKTNVAIMLLTFMIKAFKWLTYNINLIYN